MASTPHIVRPVGCVNHWNTARHSLGLYRCVINTSRYTIPNNTASTTRDLQTALQHALAAVVQKHGILRVGIVGEDTKSASFVQIPRLELAQMIQWTENDVSGSAYPDDDPGQTDRLLRRLERQHEQLWEQLDTRPGWKLLVQENKHGSVSVSLDISLCFHHAYMDGKSGSLFHRDLLEALNNQRSLARETAEFPVILHFPAPPDIPEAAETLIPFKLSFWYILQTVWEELVRDVLVPSWLRQTPSPDTIPWTGKPMNPEPHKANLRCMRISPASLEPLLRACRANKATLTTLLYALVSASLSSHLPAAEAPCFKVSCPVSLSRYAKPPFDPETMLHCLVTACEYTARPEMVSTLRKAMLHDSSSTTTTTPAAAASTGAESDADESIWAIAHSFTKTLRDKVARLPRDDIVALSSWVPDWHGFFTSKFGKKRGATFEISNIGSLSAEAAGHGNNKSSNNDGGGGDQHWAIDRTIFSQGAMPVGPAFGVSVAGVERHGVWVTVSWQEDAVDQDGLLDEVVNDLQRWVDGFAGTGRFLDGSR